MTDIHQAIAAKAEHDVMACIGCNDCLLACPLPQARSVTIAELNFAVLQPVITQPAVSDFALACTQCQQCVPVCPADLSRADMVLFNKIKLEEVVPDGEIMLQTGVQVAPSGWTLDRLANRLTRFTLFEGVSPGELRRLLLKVTLRRLKAGDTLCREGEYHERLYVMLEGHLEQITRTSDPTRPGTRVLVLGPGSFHGEMAVLANNPELYTLLALIPLQI